MKFLLKVSFIALVALLSTTAMAQEDLAQSMNCTNCHNVSKQLVGPSFKAIAAKYRGDKEAVDRLTTNVMQGSSGIWGKYAMPANPQVSAEDAKKLVNWILTQR